MLLDRAIATLASVGTGLYPDFNVFEVAKPYARELMVERFTPHRVAARTQAELRNYFSMARDLPYQLHDVLEEFRDGEMEIQFRHRGLDQLTQSMDLVFNRLTIAVISAAGLISSSLIGIFADTGPRVFGLHLFSVMGFLLSALLALWLIIGVVRSGRL
jgi:ubiquinone biosynthesis protein